jgi:hypothetical protein
MWASLTTKQQNEIAKSFRNDLSKVRERWILIHFFKIFFTI